VLFKRGDRDIGGVLAPLFQALTRQLPVLLYQPPAHPPEQAHEEEDRSKEDCQQAIAGLAPFPRRHARALRADPDPE
jgi:hypothetical protein